MATNQNAPPPIANTGGTATDPQMVARAYSAIGRLVNEGGLPPLAVKHLVAANTRLLALTLAAQEGEAEPAEDPEATDEKPKEGWADDASEWPKEKVGGPHVDPDAAIKRADQNIETAAADVPETKRTLVPSPFMKKSVRDWAQGEGARRAMLPRPQRRG